jgi:hypothetical protein
VHKVQHKPRKKFNRGQRNLEQDIRVCCQVSGAPGQGPNEHATLGFLLGVLCYNSPDCLVCTGHVRWANGATVNCTQRSTVVNSKQCTVQKSEDRAVKSECTKLSGVPSECPVPQEDKGLQQSIAPNPNILLMWHAPDSEQCHVRCTIGLSCVPVDSKVSQQLGSGWRL